MLTVGKRLFSLETGTNIAKPNIMGTLPKLFFKEPSAAQ